MHNMQKHDGAQWIDCALATSDECNVCGWIKDDTRAGRLQVYTYRRVPYFVDYRLQQFRSNTPIIRFVDFREDLGDAILVKMIREGVADTNRIKI